MKEERNEKTAEEGGERQELWTEVETFFLPWWWLFGT